MPLLAGTARAEIDQAKYTAAEAALRQFAAEMTELVPCGYIAYAGMKTKADPVENTYGELAVTVTIQKFIAANDGSAAQTASLMSAVPACLQAGVHPGHPQALASLQRQRLMIDMAMLRGYALPLDLRPPFNDR